jgi:hypothetical protein
MAVLPAAEAFALTSLATSGRAFLFPPPADQAIPLNGLHTAAAPATRPVVLIIKRRLILFTRIPSLAVANATKDRNQNSTLHKVCLLRAEVAHKRRQEIEATAELSYSPKGSAGIRVPVRAFEEMGDGLVCAIFLRGSNKSRSPSRRQVFPTLFIPNGAFCVD